MNNKQIRCIITDDEPVARKGLQGYVEKINFLELIAVCEDAVQLNNIIKQQQADLLFLDIEMPYVTGIEFLKNLSNAPKVIFTTAYEHYAIQGFELDVLDYLLKPISFDRFLKAVNRVMDASFNGTLSLDKEPQAKDPGAQHIYFRTNRKMTKIALADIIYIESFKDYIKIITTTGTVITKQSISSVEDILPNDLFIRVHRSFIVSLNKIESYSNEQERS